MCTCEVCVGMCTWVQYPHRPEEGTPSPGAGVSGACEPADIGSGKELSSSGRAVDDLNHWAISPANLNTSFQAKNVTITPGISKCLCTSGQ